jgi:hypothetical protein
MARNPSRCLWSSIIIRRNAISCLFLPRNRGTTNILGAQLGYGYRRDSGQESWPSLQLSGLSTWPSSAHWRSSSCLIHEVRQPRTFSTQDRNFNEPCCSVQCFRQYPTRQKLVEFIHRRGLGRPTSMEQMTCHEIGIMNTFVGLRQANNADNMASNDSLSR